MAGQMHAEAVFRTAGPFRRLFRRIAANRVAALVLGPAMLRVDRTLLSVTGGRQSLMGLLSGMPTILLTTWGARTGRKSTVPVLAVHDDVGLAVIASNYGGRRHPAWYHNLLANPDAAVMVNGIERRVRAYVTAGSDRQRLWDLGTSVYPGWTSYQRRAQGREIAIFRLQEDMAIGQDEIVATS